MHALKALVTSVMSRVERQAIAGNTLTPECMCQNSLPFYSEGRVPLSSQNIPLCKGLSEGSTTCLWMFFLGKTCRKWVSHVHHSFFRLEEAAGRKGHALSPKHTSSEPHSMAPAPTPLFLSFHSLLGETWIWCL